MLYLEAAEFPAGIVQLNPLLFPVFLYFFRPLQAAAAKRGVMLGGASRPLQPADLDEFDLVVGMVRRCHVIIPCSSFSRGPENVHLARSVLSQMVFECAECTSIFLLQLFFFPSANAFKVKVQLATLPRARVPA